MTTHSARRAATALSAAVTTALLAAPALASTTVEPSDPGAGDGKLLLVLDASGSMGDPDSAGEPKIESARTALDAVIDTLGEDDQVGLRLFSSTVSESNTAAACSDSELVVPVGTSNHGELAAAVEDYQAFGGETPIGYALQQAGQDLGSEGQRSILLVSDGLSTCDPDPCEVAQDLTEDGIDLRIHVVGFDVDAEARQQLQCVADAGNGRYVDATDTDSLTAALQTFSTRAFRPFTVQGEPVEGTLKPAQAPELTPGQYTDTMAQDKAHAKHYRLTRTVPGSRLYAGVTMRPGRGGVSDYQLRLETVDGTLCGTAAGTPFSAGGNNSFGTAVTNSGEMTTGNEECAAADELILRLYPGGASEAIVGEPMEIVITETPPPTNAEQLPEEASRPQWEQMSPGKPVAEVVAGSSLNDAPLIEPGQTYSSVLTRGELVFFRVPVEYGQRLQALVEFPRPDGALAGSTGGATDLADILVVGPTRGRADDVLADLGELNTRTALSATSPVQLATTTPEVRWASYGSGTAPGASTMAGDYYIGVSLSSSQDLLLPVPFTLSTELIGEVSGEPEFAEAATEATPENDDAEEAAVTETPSTTQDDTDDAAAATQESPEETASAAPQAAADAGTSRGMLLGLGALGTALLGAGIVVLVRALRS